jgi:hypothetical protein
MLRYYSLASLIYSSTYNRKTYDVISTPRPTSLERILAYTHAQLRSRPSPQLQRDQGHTQLEGLTAMRTNRTKCIRGDDNKFNVLQGHDFTK